MRISRIGISALALLALGGCVAVPVGPGYYAADQYPGPAYPPAPVYYGPPAVYAPVPSFSFGIYGGRGYGGYGHHHHRRGYRH